MLRNIHYIMALFLLKSNAKVLLDNFNQLEVRKVFTAWKAIMSS